MHSNSPFLTPSHILRLEDNKADAKMIHALIGHEWPGCFIKFVGNREEFLPTLQAEEFDLMLSDFTLPAFNGLEALALVREH